MPPLLLRHRGQARTCRCQFFAILWPWIGVGAAGALLLVLFSTDGLQANRTGSRWTDLPWLVWLGLAACLLHDFEANGVDLRGVPYAFRGDLCRVLGIATPLPARCRFPSSPPPTWRRSGAPAAGRLAGTPLAGPGLSFFALVLVKALLPMGAAVTEGRYVPGLFTSCLVLLPLCLWTLSVALTRAGIPKPALAAVVAAAVAAPLILIASLQAYLHDYMGLWPLNIVQLLNGFMPAG